MKNKINPKSKRFKSAVEKEINKSLEQVNKTTGKNYVLKNLNIKTYKSIPKKFLLILFLFSFTSCATVLGGRIDECQKVKPPQGARALRPGAFIADLIIWPPFLAVDFITGAIYKPCK